MGTVPTRGDTGSRPGPLSLFTLAILIGFGGCRSPLEDSVDAGTGSDAAQGVDSGPQIGCDPYEPRAVAPELFIGPQGLENRLLGEIDAAESELWVLMYLITMESFTDALIAAHDRGVDVRVLLDPDHPGNVDSRNALAAAGVPVRDAPAQFTHAHSKAMLIDGDTAVIMSSNLNYLAMTEERNYGVVDRDPEDVADLRAIFESDWADEGYPDLSCTRLLVAPINARARLLQHSNRAQTQLDLAVLYLLDTSVESALIDRHREGVSIRVLLADPSSQPENVDTADTLAQEGIPVRFARSISLHAKLVIADGVPFVGSQNLSFTSLNENREVGLMVTESPPATQAQSQFATDWSAGQAP